MGTTSWCAIRPMAAPGSLLPVQVYSSVWPPITRAAASRAARVARAARWACSLSNSAAVPLGSSKPPTVRRARLRDHGLGHRGAVHRQRRQGGHLHLPRPWRKVLPSSTTASSTSKASSASPSRLIIESLVVGGCRSVVPCDSPTRRMFPARHPRWREGCGCTFRPRPEQGATMAAARHAVKDRRGHARALERTRQGSAAPALRPARRSGDQGADQPSQRSLQRPPRLQPQRRRRPLTCEITRAARRPARRRCARWCATATAARPRARHMASAAMPASSCPRRRR